MAERDNEKGEKINALKEIQIKLKQFCKIKNYNNNWLETIDYFAIKNNQL